MEPKKRGPKPGAKRAKAEMAALTQRPGDVAVPFEQLTSSQRDNPRYLTGDRLKDHGHRNGLSRSEMAKMSDEKIRGQLSRITAHQRETETT